MISVVIPAHNSEERILRCVDSVLHQKSDEEAEVIVVDDGSSDDTYNRLLECYGKDARVHIYSQSNSGVSVARNKGIEAARGQVILFLDSDDYLCSGSIQAVSNIFKQTNFDILFASFELSDGKGTRTVNELDTDKKLIEQEDKGRVVSCFLDGIGFNGGEKAFSGAVWGKAYRKSFIEVNHLAFDPDLRRAQDIEFNTRAINLARLIANRHIPLSHYELREGSLSHRKNPLLLDQYTLFLKKVREDLQVYQDEGLRNDYYWMAMNLTLDLWKRGGIKIRRSLENELLREAERSIMWSPKRGIKHAAKWLLFKLKAYGLLERIAEARA